MGLFRQEAVEGRRRTLHGEVMIFQPLTARVLTIAVLVITVSVLVFASLVSFARKETAPGWIVPDQGMAEAYAPGGAIVQDLAVRVGDKVASGQVLATVSTETYDAAGAVGERQRSQIASQLSEVDAQLAASRERGRAEVAGTREQVAATTSAIAVLEGQRRLQVAQLTLARAQYDRAEPLVSKGFISRFDQDRRQQSVLGLEQAIGGIEQQIQAQRVQLSSLRTQLRDAPSRQAIEESQLRASRAGLAGQESAAAARSGATLRAPVGGVVVAVNLRPGETAKPGIPVVSIAPPGKLGVEVLLPTRASGFVRAGQDVRVAIDAFPSQRYGMLVGIVEQVSRAAVSPKEYSAPIQFQEASYVVRVRLPKQNLDANGTSLALRPGMSVSATLITDRRTIWQWLFDPLLAARQVLGA